MGIGVSIVGGTGVFPLEVGEQRFMNVGLERGYVIRHILESETNQRTGMLRRTPIIPPILIMQADHEKRKVSLCISLIYHPDLCVCVFPHSTPTS